MPAWHVLVGCFMIFLGLLWVVWPQILRGWVVSKTSSVIFWMLVALFFSPLVSLVKHWDRNAWMCAIITFFVVGSLLKSLIGKAAQKIPSLYFRLAGVLNILSGLFFVLVSSQKLK